MSGVFAAVFIALYVGHMLGDHVVQTDHQAAHKSGPGLLGWGALLTHVGTYGLTQTLALSAAGVVLDVPATGLGVTLGVAFSMATHGFIDRRWPVQWLCRHTGSEAFGKLAGHGLNGAYLVDQTLHIACLFVSALLIAGIGGAAS